MKIVVIHGPNLNLLGTREPEVYGTRTLEDLDRGLVEYASQRGAQLDTFQSNQEGDIVDRIQKAAAEGVDAIVINPGAYTHTSLAIADALAGVATPAIEVHISNIHGREPERSRSLTAGACYGIVSGFGFESYILGIDAALSLSKR
jgi:3-dehydroquinate dehydratase-2